MIKSLYKYRMLICYVLLFLTFQFPTISFYEEYELYGSNLFGASILFCLSEYYSALLLRECKWQKGLIIGVASYCIINIIFIDNFSDLYYDIAQSVSFLIAGTYVLIQMIIEEKKK